VRIDQTPGGELRCGRSTTGTSSRGRDIIYALDLKGRFLYYNSMVWHILGYGPTELIGKHFRQILTPASAAVAAEHFRRGVAAQVPTFFEVDAIRRDGGVVHLEVHATTLFHAGVAVGRQGIARDVTELHRLRAEVATKGEHIALLEDRNRIAQELYDTIARVVFRGGREPGPTDNALLTRVRDSLAVEVARSLGLSETDRRVIALIAQGRSNKEIGAQIHLSPETVKDHVARIMKRLRVKRRTELVAEAARLGFL
jgi:PAS domain S-box-containing protein